MKPRLNPRAPALLLGLCYRALAGEADPQNAALTLRRLEHLQTDYTTAYSAVSSLKADVQIARQKAQSAAHDAKQSGLDQRIFDERHPPPAKPRRGLLARRLSTEEQEIARQRSELTAGIGLLDADAQQKQAQAEALAQRFSAAEAELTRLAESRLALAQQLRRELAAAVLTPLASGQYAEALAQLSDARRVQRGDLLVAQLYVLAALLGSGEAAAREMLREFTSIFSQHADPLARVLEAFIDIYCGRTPPLKQLLLLNAEQFSIPAQFRFYQLVCVLSGHSAGAVQLESGVTDRTLAALEQCLHQLAPPTDYEPRSSAELVQWANAGDALTRLLCVHALWLRGATSFILPALDIDFVKLQPPRRQKLWPALLPLLDAAPLPHWPPALAAPVHCALCCHVLLAAKEHVPSELYETWLAESYGWQPKDALYWWTLSTLKNDPGLLERASAEGMFQSPPGLFIVDGL